MPQDMRLRRTLIQKLALWAASFVVAVAASAPVGQFFIALADERGWYQNPSSRLAGMMEIVAAIANNSWFHWIGGAIVGFSMGVYFDYLLKKREALSSASILTQPMTSNAPSLPESLSSTIVRMKIVGIVFESNLSTEMYADIEITNPGRPTVLAHWFLTVTRPDGLAPASFMPRTIHGDRIATKGPNAGIMADNFAAEAIETGTRRTARVVFTVEGTPVEERFNVRGTAFVLQTEDVFENTISARHVLT